MSRIEFGQIKIGSIARKHIKDCLKSNWVTMGPKVKLFEEKWKQLFYYKHARLLSSGTAANTACCMALYELVGAKPGDEIICPALSFIASATSIRAAGFKPVFVDVHMDTMNIDENQIIRKITNKTRAILSVNLMGVPARLADISNIARMGGLIHIIDNCEAYGSQYYGKYALEYGDMETSSHFTAHIIQSGEGGVVSTNDPKIDGIIEAIRSHGRIGGDAYFDHKLWGLNFKNTDLHASIGLEGLEKFWEVFNKRAANLARIRNNLNGYEDLAWFTPPLVTGGVCAPHGFSIVLKPALKQYFPMLKSTLNYNDIHWKRNFGCMATQHTVFSTEHKLGDFPNAEYIGDYGLHIGVHQYLRPRDIHRINKVLKDFFEGIKVI